MKKDEEKDENEHTMRSFNLEEEVLVDVETKSIYKNRYEGLYRVIQK